MDLTGFRLGRIFGIPIRVHFTFLLVIPLITYAFGRAFIAAAELAEVPPEALTGSPWLWGLGVAFALFLSVLVHELAHSIYAIRKGGRVRDITLLMIGGVSRIAEPPREHKQEAVMAGVGPLVSLGLGAALFALHSVLDQASFNARFALFYVAGLNVFLGMFNLIPAFPMDGGRILRALLATRVGVVRATEVAARIGKGFAVLFGLWGVVSFNLLLLLIAFFVYAGAEGEARAVAVKSLLGKLSVRDVMKEPPPPLPAFVSAHDAAERMLSERRSGYTVELEAGGVGLLTLDAVRVVPPERRRELTAGQLARREPAVAPSDPANEALKIMGELDARELAVSEGGRIVGTVGRDDILRELELMELDASQHRPAPRMGGELRV